MVPTHDIRHLGAVKRVCKNIPLLRSVKTLIEKHYCKEKLIVSTLAPSVIRIQSITPHLIGKAPEEDAKVELDKVTGCDLWKLVKSTQVGFTSEQSVLQGFPEVKSLLT